MMEDLLLLAAHINELTSMFASQLGMKNKFLT